MKSVSSMPVERTKGASKDSDLAVCLLWLMAFTTRPLRVQVGAFDALQASEVRLIIQQILRLDGPLNRHACWPKCQKYSEVPSSIVEPTRAVRF